MAFIIGGWQLTAELGLINVIFFSNPSEILNYIINEFEISIWSHAVSTVWASVLAFLIGSVTAIIVGFVMVTFTSIEEAFDPYLTLMNAFPRVALAPLFIAWLGIGIASKVVTSITLIFFIVLVNVIAGAKNTDSDLIRLFDSLGASRLTRFGKLVLPTAIPSIFAGLKLALIYSMLAVIVAEMMGGSKGLGYQVALLSNTFHMDGVFAVLIVVALITTGMATITSALEHRLLRWQKQ
jgi:NitT/TauT family transport system permease protein